MSKAATATVAVTVQGDGLNTTDYDVLQNAAAVAPTSATLSAGNNTITLPSGTLRVKVKPVPGNAVSLTLKGVAGDTGLPLNPGEPSYVSFLTGTTSFVLNAGGTVTVSLVWC